LRLQHSTGDAGDPGDRLLIIYFLDRGTAVRAP